MIYDGTENIHQIGLLDMPLSQAIYKTRRPCGIHFTWNSYPLPITLDNRNQMEQSSKPNDILRIVKID